MTRESSSRRLGHAAVRLGLVVALIVLLVVAGPSASLWRLVVGLAVLLVLGFAILELVVRASPERYPDLADLTSRALLIGWVAKNEASVDEHRLDVFRQVFYDGRDARDRMFRYGALMFFASVIAAAGVISDSTAVVIGAMLIAPLITPMMGMALGLVLGWPTRLLKASLLVLTGVTIAVGIGWLLPLLTSIAVDVEVNSQIVSRTSPTLLDLLVAIAAGAAGSYALARPDISSSLPGVAIAIALVPPLSVVGILINLGEWSLARGASLLFATNLVAILVTGTVVFILSGVAPLHRLDDAQKKLRVALVALGVFALAVVGALAANGASITRDSLDSDEARATTLTWLEGSELSLASLDFEDDRTTVVLVGTGDPPDVEVLADDLEDELGRRVVVDVQWIPRNRTIVDD